MTPEVVELGALSLEWAEGSVVAAGAVTVRMGDQSLTGERAVWEGDRIVVEHGTYTRPDGVISFEHAEILVSTRVADLVEVDARAGEARLLADGVRLEAGEWQAVGAELEPCACADGRPGALTLRARRIELVPGSVAVLHGGTVRVFGVPALWTPYWRVPLDPRRFRLELPQVRHGEDGWAASLAARGGVGDWTLRAGPAWREDRGARVEAEGRGPEGVAQAAVGWDAVEERVRGIVVSEGGFGRRVAWDVEVPSDRDYVNDHAVDWVARGVTWRESRAVWGLGPSRLDAWVPDDGSAGVLARERVRVEWGRATAVAPRAELALVGTTEDAAPVGLVGVDARTTARPGPLWFSAQADASAFLAEEAGFDVVSEARLGLPLWSEAGSVRVQWWPQVRATGSLEAWSVGPALAAESVVGGTTVAASAELGWDGEGVEPGGSLSVRGDAVSLRARGDARVQAGELRVEPAPLSLALGGARAEGLELAWTDAGLAPGRLRVGGGLAWDLAAGAYSGASARLGYDDGCVAATITAAFAPDREIPDVGATVALRR